MKNKYIDLIIENEKFIYKIASKFYNIDSDDLYQCGVIGLIKAVKNFKDKNKTKFSTYAYDYIFGEMYNYMTKRKNIKINKESLKLYKKICNVKDYLTQKLSREPSITEISLFLEVEESIVSDIILSAESIISIDEEKEGLSLHESISNPKLDIDDTYIDIMDSLNKLDDSEKEIIKYRYYKDLTQSETAKKLNMTQVMVSRYEKRSLEKMRDYLAS